MFTRKPEPQPQIQHPPPITAHVMPPKAPAPTVPDYAAMDYLQLREIRKQIDELIEAKAAEARAAFQRDFVDKLHLYGLSIEDIAKPKKEKKPREVKAKYRHPDDPTVEWSGRGKAPKWMQEYLDQGRLVQEFEIKG